MDFSLRESQINMLQAFPNLPKLRQSILNMKASDPHRTVELLLEVLWDGMFQELSKTLDEDSLKQSCSLGFVACTQICGIESYILEGCEVKKEEFFAGRLGAEAAEEKYAAIGHNPSFIAELRIGPRQLLVSPRHFRLEGGRLKSLLRHECHREASMSGETCVHWEDPSRSGIYLANLWGSIHQPVWRKEFYDKKPPRVYAAISRSKVIVE